MIVVALRSGLLAGILLVFGGLAITAQSTTAGAGGRLTQVGFNALSGWTDDRHSLGLRAFQRSCRKLVRAPAALRIGPTSVPADRVAAICSAALELGSNADDDAARRFFETWFDVAEVTDTDGGESLFTGYFEPEYMGSRTRGGDYPVPIYARPPDLERTNTGSGVTYGRRENGRLVPYFTRREIEAGALDGRGLELLYLKSYADAFFAHIQGSARILLDTGDVAKIAFAAKNGHEYFAIGRTLIERGEVAREEMSMQAIRSWLERNPEQARALMWQNDSFIFFREIDAGEPGIGPPGAAEVGLTPGRSLAVDKRIYSYGLPMWLQTTIPVDGGADVAPFNHLMIAQDTGSAIIGAVRGDVFVGSGSAAGEIAGLMKQEGRLFVLVPRATAAQPAASSSSPAASATGRAATGGDALK